MSNDQKRRLAQALLSRVGDMFEYWDDLSKVHGMEDLDRVEAEQIVAQWLRRLPGDVWDERLPQPK